MPLTAADLSGKRRHKYGAKPVTVDGIRFHSTKEASRYRELKLLVHAGSIRALELQPKFALRAPRHDYNCASRIVGEYRGDFRYEELTEAGWRWAVVVEDVKGMDTPLSKWKRRHFEAQYGIEVRIV